MKRFPLKYFLINNKKMNEFRVLYKKRNALYDRIREGENTFANTFGMHTQYTETSKVRGGKNLEKKQDYITCVMQYNRTEWSSILIFSGTEQFYFV